ncbi:MAG: hypothetical protein Q7U09_21920 [Hydrogenophaga sp.]|jgi:hypothetical protein|nr:hypothetical protein [Hydrogenophaga sp.]
MLTSTELLERLERTFGRGSERLVAESLFSFLTRYPETTHVSLQLMRQRIPGAGSGEKDVEILRALQFLAGDGIALLETKFEIFDLENHPCELDKQVVKEALALKVNPLTGDDDPDVAAKIVMFFAPHPEAIKQLGAND